MTAGAGKIRECIDCPAEGITTKRPAPHPGPRCASHDRKQKARQRARAKARYVENTYGLTDEEYYAILEEQGGVCYGCRRAKGNGRKRLAVDHDHSCCPGPISCGRCIRGLLCQPCNRDVLGHLRDEIAAFYRFIDYLENPPAQRVLNRGDEWTRPVSSSSSTTQDDAGSDTTTRSAATSAGRSRSRTGTSSSRRRGHRTTTRAKTTSASGS